MPYPVTFESDYIEKRSRLSTFFRLILAIPHVIVLYLWSLAAIVVAIIAWFAIVFTGRWPQGLYDFSAGYWRYSTAVTGYVALLTDEYPPFGTDTGSYPVRLRVAQPQASYSRLKTFFRFILAIPVSIIAYAMQIVAWVGAVLAWFAIVILGRQPKGLHDMIVLGVSYQQRANTYIYLLTESWPPFTDDSASRVEAAPAFGSLPPTPPAAGPEAPTSVPAGGEAAPPAPPPPPEAPPGTPAGPPTPGAPETPPTTPHGDPLADEAEPTPASDDEEDRPPGPFGPSGT